MSRILLCGGEAHYDRDSETGEIYGETCTDCLCVVGSVGMPTRCKELYKKDQMWRALAERGLTHSNKH